MKRKFKVILSLGFAALFCAGFAACAKETEVEKIEKQGYDVSVTYDPNGGKVSSRTSVTIVDMFNPDEYKDNNGVAYIKLLDPQDKNRKVNNDEIQITKAGYFLAGWYKNRVLVTNEDGNPVDIYGEEIELVDEKKNSYVYPESGAEAIPAYTYSERWDFNTDIIEYVDEGQKYSMTLYAGWVPYYEYNYYYKDAQTNEWTKYAKTTFDWLTATTNADFSNRDTLFTPRWSDIDAQTNEVSGFMNYQHLYDEAVGAVDTEKFAFPKITGKTFKAAYLDENCQNFIDGSYEHAGTLELATAKPINWQQNVYVEFDEGEQYKIKTAEQLANNPNLIGHYEILADLDFTEQTWPALFTTGAFDGKFYSKPGNTFTISNVSAILSTTNGELRTDELGGLFGSLTKNAVMENVSFVNATLDIASMGTRSNEASYATFIGLIDDGATVSGVSFSGTMKLGPITPGKDFALNLLANGKITGITVGDLHLTIYGNGVFFTVNTEKLQEAITAGTVVKENYEIALTFVSRYKDKSGNTSYVIQ